MSSVFFWRYTLRSAAALNAASARREHEGALIRVGEGFGCLHPWPELGDAPIEGQLRELAQGPPFSSRLILGALECADRDGEARREGRSLFRGKVPESHCLVREGDDPDRARAEGFTHAKIKGSPDLKRVRGLVGAWVGAGLRVRLDFNESLATGAFLSFWKGLDGSLREAIDFVEDPETWNEVGWGRLREAGVPVAVDRDHATRLREGDVLVYKPAYHDPRDSSWERNRTVCFTSNMDHAVGQFWAAAFASIAEDAREAEGTATPGGLLTHRCFEKDAFFERIRCEGPRLVAPGGCGLGFDDLLERLPWKRLT